MMGPENVERGRPRSQDDPHTHTQRPDNRSNRLLGAIAMAYASIMPTRHLEVVEEAVSDQLDRRRDATARMAPLESGERDPWVPNPRWHAQGPEGGEW